MASEAEGAAGEAEAPMQSFVCPITHEVRTIVARNIYIVFVFQCVLDFVFHCVLVEFGGVFCSLSFC